MDYKIKTVSGFCKDGVTMPFYFFVGLRVHWCRLGGHSVALFFGFQYENFENAVKTLNISESELFKPSSAAAFLMYRARENRGGDVTAKDYEDEEMFHIPLYSRRIISTQRYSFPGLPCLYLGASVYTCWVELNRPAFENFQVAAIATTPGVDGYSIVDMSNIPQRLSDLKKELKFTPEEYLQYWPLLALCSIKVRNESGSFKPEYIFPQFLLEYIQKNQEDEAIVGVKYVSIKAATVSDKQLKMDWHGDKYTDRTRKWRCLLCG